MDEYVYQQARHNAKKLIDLCWDGTVPVDLSNFFPDLDVDLHYADISPILGLVAKNVDEKPVMVVSSSLSERRSRLVTAQLMGHVTERAASGFSDSYSFGKYPGDSKGYDVFAFFADEFAESLLMPSYVFDPESGSPYELSNRFNAPIVTAEHRIERLRKHPE